jgi:HPt (histidine-containing phosphotransfer) domain-containing protein
MTMKNHTNLNILSSVCEQLPDPQASMAFWRESLELSIESLSTNLIRFNTVMTSKNSKELEAVVHKIAGTVAFVGVETLSERLLQIQCACANDTMKWPLPDESEIRTQVTQIIGELELAKNNPPI